MFEDPGLSGKVVLITGGSRGIGRELVLRFAEEGCEVAFLFREDSKAAEETASLAAQRGRRVTAVRADVRDRDACRRAVGETEDSHGEVGVLVNNSGVIRDNLVALLTEEEVRTVVDTNLVGVLNMIQAVIPGMIGRHAGKIINISSAVATKGGRGQANYAASKGAVEALTRSLAVELARKKIAVNAVAPGVIETDMTRELLASHSDDVRKRILLGRFGRPEDVAPAVLFLASRFGDYITGQVLHVDGGFKMG